MATTLHPQPDRSPENGTDALSILNIRNILTVAMVGVAFYLLSLLRGVLALFLAAMVIAFLLYPMVQWIGQLPLGRGRKLGAGPAILLLYLIFTAFLVLIFVLVGGLLQEQIGLLQDSITSGLLQEKATELKQWLLNSAEPLARVNLIKADELELQLSAYQAHYIGELKDWFAHLNYQNLLSTVFGNAGQVLMVMVSLPILVFYMIVDAHPIRTTLMGFVPPAFQENTTDFLHNLELTLNSYLRGQIKLGFAIFLLDAVLLLLFVPQVTAWLLIALIAGVTEIIPVVGPTIALIIALVIAAIETSADPNVLIKIALIFTGVQMVENQFLVPRIMGKQLGVHPLTVMFFLLAGGALGGVVGALLSLPIAATLKVTVTQYYPAFIQRVQALLTDDDRPTGAHPVVIVPPGTSATETV